ncbi:MAG: hypothetical protein E6K82_19545 [Candidatus Rokuibacteriota bacterium]|nr:MAG: hypothetical protein E6K82_19545 [Candidatus Rokubacteria bacterium]
MATKILFSPKFPKPVFDIAVEMTPPGFELVPVDSTGSGFLEAARDAEYFMGFGRNPLSHDFYAAAKKMKLVQLISAGYNTLDLEAARKAGVPIANNGGANSVAVAEHAVMLILATLKKLAWQHKNCVEGRWRVGDFAETRLYELEGKTVGIVGLGNIGKKVARRLHGFDVKIVYYDIVRLPEHEEDALGVRFDEADRGAGEHVPGAGRGRDRPAQGAHHQAHRRRRPRRDGGRAALEGQSPAQRRDHHDHAAHGRPDVGELGQGVPQRLRQHPARPRRPQADVGDPGAAELGVTPAERSSIDDIVDLYKRDVDRTLIRERLSRSIEERLEDLMNFEAFADELREAGRRARLHD